MKKIKVNFVAKLPFKSYSVEQKLVGVEPYKIIPIHERVLLQVRNHNAAGGANLFLIKKGMDSSAGYPIPPQTSKKIRADENLNVWLVASTASTCDTRILQCSYQLESE